MRTTGATWFIVCDKCRAESPKRRSKWRSEQKAVKRGWTLGKQDYCPACTKEEL